MQNCDFVERIFILGMLGNWSNILRLGWFCVCAQPIGDSGRIQKIIPVEIIVYHMGCLPTWLCVGLLWGPRSPGLLQGLRLPTHQGWQGSARIDTWSNWTLKQVKTSGSGYFFFKMEFYFLILFPINVISLYKTGPIQWIYGQHSGYWWPRALAPGHQ